MFLTLSIIPQASSASESRDQSHRGLLCKYTVPMHQRAGTKKRITSVQYSPDGREVLVSYSSDNIYIFNPEVS